MVAGARASNSAEASSAGRPASGQTRSPAMPSTSRDVASTCISDERPSRSSTTAATASTTCSQLSSTRSIGRVSIHVSICSSPTPSAAAMAGRTASPSSTLSRDTHHTATSERSATSVARRVFRRRPDRRCDQSIVGERGCDALEVRGAADEGRQRTSDGRSGRRSRHERRVVPQDRTLQRRQRRSRVEPQLLGEHARRASWYAARASACRPLRYNASISCSRRRSRSG